MTAATSPAARRCVLWPKDALRIGFGIIWLIGCFAVALGVVLGVPDQIFATLTQYAFLAAPACEGCVVGGSQARRPPVLGT